jgi:ParB family chromosome partitioning protein
MARRSGLGRGLAALIPNEETGDEGSALREVPIANIRPNAHQPRSYFDEEAMSSLAASIRELGVLQPILVREIEGEPDSYELIAGERRWRAAQMAGLDTVLALVRDHDDAASLELALVENMVREDLNPIDEARACAALVEELGLTREEVGLRVARSRVAVSNLIRLLDLPDEAIDLLERGVLSEGHGRALLLAPENSTRRSLARQAAAAGWSVRELEARARASSPTAHAGSRRRSPAVDHPDRQAAADQISDILGEAFGADVHVRPSPHGFTAQLTIASLDEAVEFAGRLRAPRVA